MTTAIPPEAVPPGEDPQAYMDRMTGNAPAENLIAGKYKTQEDLHKGLIEALTHKYGDPEKAYRAISGNLKPETPPAEPPPAEPPPAGTQPGDPPPASTDPTTQIPETNFEAYAKEFNETGTLSEESIKQLETRGIPKRFVDTYIQGLKALQTSADQAIFDRGGGQAEYSKMVQWASMNLPVADIKAYNKALQTGDPEIVNLAIDGLKAKFQMGAGTPPKTRVTGTNGGTVTGFATNGDLQKAVADPRYHTDPDYRQSVIDRLAASMKR